MSSSQRSSGRSARATLFRVVRRTHLYLGLFLSPFVLFFGLTGLSFNHPTVGRGLSVVRVSADTVHEVTGFSTWQADRVADEVVRGLRRQGSDLRRDADAGASFGGWPLFSAPAEGGRQSATFSVEEGWARFTHRPSPSAVDGALLDGITVELPDRSMAELSALLGEVAEHAGVSVGGTFEAHPRVHPVVRFVVVDEGGKHWNVVYDLATGSFETRPRGTPRAQAWIELFESVHKQHHYPPQPSAAGWWAMFADITALTLLLWVLTGLVMWWQMRRLRVVGAVVLVLGILTSSLVIGGTISELTFGNPTSRGGG